MIDQNLINEILADSASLLQKNAAMEQELESLRGLQQKTAELETSLSQTKEAQKTMKEKLAAKFDAFASKLVDHGTLTPENKLAFLNTLNADPSQVIDVMDRMAGSVPELGAGVHEEKEASVETNDRSNKDDASCPLVKFALGDR